MSGSGDESSIESSNQSERAVRTLDAAELRTKPIAEWSIQNVAAFLQAQGFGNEIVSAFVNEMIAGVELIELDSSDLRELGLIKMGPRKKLISKINKLKTKGSSALDDSETTATHSASESESGSANAVSVTALFKKQKQQLNVSNHVTLEKLLLLLSNAFGVRVKVKFVDDEGDQVPIKSDSDLYDVLVGEENITLQCVKDFKWKATASARGSAAAPAIASSSSSAKKFASQYEMFNSLLDAYIVIDEDGSILAFNPQSEKLFGYAARKVLGKNVKMLMPDTYAVKHDAYLARYARTGIKHVIDSKRTVMAKHSSGDMMAVELAVTEKADADGDASHYVAVLKPQDQGDGSSSTSTDGGSVVKLDHRLRNNLNALHEAAIVIDNVGTILLFNAAAEKLFGYKSGDILGKAIEQLMPSPHKENHAFYLQRYVATGEKTVMNSSRNVQACHANGSLIDVNLSLSEKETKAGETVFVGLLSGVKASVKSQKQSSALQMTRRLINSMTVPGVVINEQGIIQAFNRTAEKLLGYALIDCVGRNVSMLMNDDDAPKHDSYLNNYLTTGEEKVIGKERVVLAKHKSGKLIKVQLSVTVAEDENGKKLFTGMMHRTKSDNAASKAKRKKKTKVKSSS